MASGFKKKTPVQVQTLEKSYNEEKYPNQIEMAKCAKSLGLTYTQVKTWFKERRRKERRETDPQTTNQIVNSNSKKINNNGLRLTQVKKRLIKVRVLYPKDYILRKVFRKDGPPLGYEFDPPLISLGFKKDNEKDPCSQIQTNTKKRKISQILDASFSNPKKTVDTQIKVNKTPKPKTQKRPLQKPKTLISSFEEPQTLNVPPPRTHGMGKGLMTIWKTTNSQNREFPQELNSLLDRNVSFNSSTLTSISDKKKSNKKTKIKKPISQNVTPKKIENKKKKPLNNRKVPGNKGKDQKGESHHSPSECELSVDKLDSSEGPNGQSTLVDDEELELQELQVGPNPLRCSAHLASSGTHGCALCKDLLAKFPPQNVKMKQPFSAKPWDSSPELVKKLFKVLRFIYTHSSIINIDAFTIDEFVQSFHDKDSMLMGKVHVALLELLLSDVEKAGIDDFAPISSKDCRFINFLTFFREQELDANFMITSLNPLTWIEILRQVVVAAGFGSKSSFSRRENFNKRKNQMVKYGLRPRTLKGEIFTLLSKKGSNGFNVSELANSPQIMELNLQNTNEEIEQLIYSTLSSDITLFEKISSNSYRLRVDPNIKGNTSNSISNSNSNSEDSGSIENGDDNNSITNGDDLDSSKNEAKNRNKIVKSKEIDESYCGEAWVLGLMEGEYSDLRIDEKLDALVSLVDLIGGTTSFLRLEEPIRTASTISKSNLYHGSGGKIKKSTINSSPSTIITNPTLESSNDISSKNGTHKTQTVYLGSDRRYNNYYLFLGPCSRDDPGHRMVFLESSEDGHWEVIDSPEDLLELLSVLDTRGIRESRLFTSLNKRQSFLIQSMETSNTKPTGDDIQTQMNSVSSHSDSSSPISDIDNNNNYDSSPSSGAILIEQNRTGEERRKSKLERSQDFDKWVWNEFYSCLNSVKSSNKSYCDTWAKCQGCHDLYWREEKHCRVCHVTFEFDFDLEEKYVIHSGSCREILGDLQSYKIHNCQLQALKASIHAIEGTMPESALTNSWTKSTHKFWVKRLQRTSSLPELLQVLVDFVGAIKEDWLYKCMTAGKPGSYMDDIIVSFQTMPQTSSALALWIVKLDSLISPNLEKSSSKKQASTVSLL